MTYQTELDALNFTPETAQKDYTDQNCEPSMPSFGVASKDGCCYNHKKCVECGASDESNKSPFPSHQNMPTAVASRGLEGAKASESGQSRARSVFSHAQLLAGVQYCPLLLVGKAPSHDLSPSFIRIVVFTPIVLAVVSRPA
jgi:hypothetical protein